MGIGGTYMGFNKRLVVASFHGFGNFKQFRTSYFHSIHVSLGISETSLGNRLGVLLLSYVSQGGFWILALGLKMGSAVKLMDILGLLEQ